MHTLENEELSVSILDPLADHERFGTRYCTGGYIFQVKNSRLGNLLSGPTYPDDFNVFDGQGIPDSFSHNPLRQQASDQEALVIGITSATTFATLIISRLRCMLRPCDPDGQYFQSGCTDQKLDRSAHEFRHS